MGDFAFYPDINKKLNYIFNIHEIIDKTIPEEFDKYLEVVDFILNLSKKNPEEIIFSLNDINSIYKKIDHIIQCTSKSGRFMKDELILLNRFRSFFKADKKEVKFNLALYPELLELVKKSLRLRNRRIRKITLWSFQKKPPYLEMNSLNNVYLFIFENNERLIGKFEMALKERDILKCTKKELYQLIGILENILFTINYLMYKSMSGDRVLFSDKSTVTIKNLHKKIKKIENVELSRLYKRTLSLWDFWPEKFQKVNVKFDLKEGAYI